MLTVRNKLAFPCGVAPGFDPTHPASKGAILSTVAANNLLKGAAPGAFTGSGVSHSIIGPAINNTATTDEVDFTTTAITDRTRFTMAGIVYFKALATFRALMGIGANTASASVALQTWSATTAFAVNPWGGTVATTSVVKPLLNTPMFAAVSCAPGIQNWVTTNLLTGAIVSEVTTTAGVASTGTPGTLQSIGKAGAQSAASAYVAAALMSGNYLPVAQLLQWANEPWRFWYPNA